MAKQRLPDYDLLDMPEDRPLVLSGPPGTMNTTIRVHNPGQQRVIVRDAHIRGVVTQPLAPIVLRPGQSRVMPISLALDPHLPPGEYQAEVQVAGYTRQAVIHVAENIDLHIAPSPVVLENRPGARLHKTVIFSNLGNVPLTIGQIGPVLVEDELIECRAGRAVLKKSIDTIETVDQFYVEMLREIRDVVDHIGFLRVRIPSAPLELAPGATKALELEILVPDKLDYRTRYRGAAAIYTSDLSFAIVPVPGIRDQPPDYDEKRPE